jgi:hypothetical protein
MGGTLTLMRIGSIRYEYAFSFGGRKESTGRHGSHVARCWVLRDRNGTRKCPGLNLWTFSCSADTFGGRQGGYRPYFENYTVDASILDLNPSGFESQNN